MPNPLVLAAIGGFTGFLAGFLGAGGGFATVVLFIAAGVAVHDAVGTSLAFTIIVGLWGTVLHLRQGTADPRLALSLGVPSIVTAILGAQAAEALDERALTLWFGVLTGAVLVALLLEPRLLRRRTVPAGVAGGGGVVSAGATIPRKEFTLDVRSVTVAGAGGAAIGALKGLFGVGGGFLLVPFMLLFLRIPERIAVGSSLFAILLGSLAGALAHSSLGNVELDVLFWTVPGGLAGSLLGARTTAKASGAVIRATFTALMLASTAYLLATSVGSRGPR